MAYRAYISDSSRQIVLKVIYNLFQGAEQSKRKEKYSTTKKEQKKNTNGSTERPTGRPRVKKY